MANPSASPGSSTTGPLLKHLGPVRVLLIHLLALFFFTYDFLKSRSGALLPAIERVEATVATVVQPVIVGLDKRGDELLVFVDGKVDNGLAYISGWVPPQFKHHVIATVDYLFTLPEKVNAVLCEARDKGVAPTARAYLEQAATVLLAYFLQVWRLILALPLVPLVAEQYNESVLRFRKTDIPLVKPLVDVLPLLPVEKPKKRE